MIIEVVVERREKYDNNEDNDINNDVKNEHREEFEAGRR